MQNFSENSGTFWLWQVYKWAVPIGILFCAGDLARDYAYFRLMGEHPALWPALRSQIIYFSFWIPAAPLPIWMLRRYPLSSPFRFRNLLIHISLYLAFTCVWVLHRYSWFPYDGDGGMRPALAYFFPRLMARALVNQARLFYIPLLVAGFAWHYYRTAVENSLRAAELREQLAVAQLQALKAQLHPHFLFNTLNSISSLIRTDQPAAEEMTVELGELLRLSLEYAGAQEVPLKQELDFVRQYLRIEKTRFEHRLEVRLDIAPETLDKAVPYLLLQPLVENSVRHGITKLKANGFVAVRSSLVNGRLILSVEDNGPGIPPSPPARTGIGLANTRARLERLYPGEHTFAVDSSPGAGTRITIHIPARASTPLEGQDFLLDAASAV